MTEIQPVRWISRYKLYFLLLLLILGVQVFLAYKSLSIVDTLNSTKNILHQNSEDALQTIDIVSNIRNQNSAGDYEDAQINLQRKQQSSATISPSGVSAVPPKRSTVDNDGKLSPDLLGFTPQCDITAKEAISALLRAKTKDCRKHIAKIACAIQSGEFYMRQLPSHCPAGNYTANASLGCYHDEKEYRLLSGYFINFKTTNTPAHCLQLCLQSGYSFAGVQYGTECFCGSNFPPSSAKLPDSSCNIKCSGDAKEICGGYFAMNIFETGIAKFKALTAETSVKPDVKRVKIAFLLTLNGRALRQVHRLIRALYSTEHVFYIHVDARQDYLYRELLELEGQFPNIRLANKRFSTIWGGASLLTMLLNSMEELLASKWKWDFVINLSESDFPVKPVNKLVDFLTANRGRNFVKSHGRETQRFIQKQGLDKTFVECDTHMWRIGDRKLPLGIQIDGGSDWVALSRPLVQYVTKEAASDELLQGLFVIFQHTLLPAESFFHTVLRNSQFCDTYVDNNLHVTNWKRKLGCKCQYKHVVDWCGCSPNDFKLDDWSRLQGTENKMLFFARKFEPIIHQAVILKLEQWLFGPYPENYKNLNSYWQSFYHSNDLPSGGDDVALTIGESVLRILASRLNTKPNNILEMTHFMHNDQYKGFLVRYQTNNQLTDNSSCFELETRIRPLQYVKVAKNSKFAKRLRSFEVSSDFDQKEQVSRNFAKMLGPYSDPVASFILLGAGSGHHDSAHSYNLTLLWIDPIGKLQDFSELHIEDSQSDAINFSKSSLQHPLMPGIWTVKLIGRSGIFAQAKFLISPLTMWSRIPLTKKGAQKVNGGINNSLFADLKIPPEWKQYLPATPTISLQNMAQLNAQKSGEDLHSWVDELVSKFYYILETCAVSQEAARQISTAALSELPNCNETSWSSFAPDPKSDVASLLKHS